MDWNNIWQALAIAGLAIAYFSTASRVEKLQKQVNEFQQFMRGRGE